MNICGGSDLTLFEVNEAATVIHEVAHGEANIIFGTTIDDEMGDEVRVTVIAAGFERWEDGKPTGTSGAGSARRGSSSRDEKSGAAEPESHTDVFASDDDDDDPARWRRRVRRSVVPEVTAHPWRSAVRSLLEPGRSTTRSVIGPMATSSITGDRGACDQRRSEFVPLEWVWLEQVHSSTVVTVDAPSTHRGAQADALVTDRADVALAVQTADCAPVLFGWSSASGERVVLGAAHAGWRGLYDGVLEATVERMEQLGADAGDIWWRLGPCISAAAYEFAVDELTTLALRFGPEVVAVTAGGRPAFDLRAAVRSTLAACGVGTSSAPEPPCTALALDSSGEPAFHSWRCPQRRRSTDLGDLVVAERTGRRCLTRTRTSLPCSSNAAKPCVPRLRSCRQATSPSSP